MSITINPVSVTPTYVPAAPSVSHAAPAATPQPAPQVSAADLVAPAVAQQTAQVQDAQRQQAVQSSAEAVKNSFPVSDVKFTIFKDNSGQYITRFTSLRDGKVTYFPEQTLFSYFRKLDSQANTPLVRIEA